MCSGCSRKGEKNMKCQYCGNEMSEGAKFCAMPWSTNSQYRFVWLVSNITYHVALLVVAKT